MNQLVFIENNRVLTDSLTIAVMFKKDHDKVMRDIHNQIEKLIEAGEKEWGTANFGETQYQHPQNKQWYKKYLLTEDAFTLVAFAYVTPEAMKMKVKFIQEFKRMLQELEMRSAPSYMIEDPIKRAEKWIEEKKAVKVLETKNAMLEQQVAEYEPKVNYLDKILNSKGTVTITQIADDYGISSQRMNKLLHEHGVQYKVNGQWLLYTKHKNQGFTKSNTVEVEHKDGGVTVEMHTRWTQKGRLFIYETLKQKGILPLMDIQLSKQLELVGRHG